MVRLSYLANYKVPIRPSSKLGDAFATLVNLFDNVSDLVTEYQSYLSEKILSETTPSIDLVTPLLPHTFAHSNACRFHSLSY